MTSTAGTDEHPEVAEISDLAEGLLPPERVADVRVHLADCVLCARRPRLPGGDPGTARHASRPAADAGRRWPPASTPHSPPRHSLDATRPEAAADATDTSADAVAAQDDTPPPAADTAHVSRETTPAVDRPLGHSGGSTGPGRTSRRARRRRRAFTAATSVAALILAGVVVHALHDDDRLHRGDGPPPRRPPAPSPEWRSPTGFTSCVTRPGARRWPRTPGRRTAGNTPFSATALALPPACVLQATGSADAPLGHRQGQLPAATRPIWWCCRTPPTPTRVDAYVVDASCAAAGPATAKGSCPRPTRSTGGTEPSARDRKRGNASPVGSVRRGESPRTGSPTAARQRRGRQP